jgi:hypothetical protein
VLTALTPLSVVAGSGAVTVQVEGSGFTAASVVQVNGTARPTTYVSATALTGALSAAEVASAGTSYSVTVSTPPVGGLGGGTSAAQTLSVVPPPPVLTAPSSGTATLTWDPETDLSVSGYKAYVGTSSNAYGAPVDIGNVTTYQIVNLQPGTTYYFAVTAYNSAGESGYSNEVSKSIP